MRASVFVSHCWFYSFRTPRIRRRLLLLLLSGPLLITEFINIIMLSYETVVNSKHRIILSNENHVFERKSREFEAQNHVFERKSLEFEANLFPQHAYSRLHEIFDYSNKY